jgi:hypothetical protein
VSERDSFLLRIDSKLLAALRKWSEDEMRSTNSQIEFLLRKALFDAGRLPKPAKPAPKAEKDGSDE